MLKISLFYLVPANNLCETNIKPEYSLNKPDDSKLLTLRTVWNYCTHKKEKQTKNFIS